MDRHGPSPDRRKRCLRRAARRGAYPPASMDAPCTPDRRVSGAAGRPIEGRRSGASPRLLTPIPRGCGPARTTRLPTSESFSPRVARETTSGRPDLCSNELWYPRVTGSSRSLGSWIPSFRGTRGFLSAPARIRTRDLRSVERAPRLAQADTALPRGSKDAWGAPSFAQFGTRAGTTVPRNGLENRWGPYRSFVCSSPTPSALSPAIPLCERFAGSFWDY
jgi:hypothetical protein